MEAASLNRKFAIDCNFVFNLGAPKAVVGSATLLYLERRVVIPSGFDIEANLKVDLNRVLAEH